MQMENTRTYHRLSLRAWENIDGPEGWAVKDRKTGKVIFKGGGRDGSGEMYDVIKAFLGSEKVEALLCAEIDREFLEVIEQ